MHIELTVADHDKNGFVSLARWPAMSEAEALAVLAGIDAEISDEIEPDIKTANFTFILDLRHGSELVDTGKRLLPTQVAMRLAPDHVRRWLDERPEPDEVINRRIPMINTAIAA
jgi:hypothetical protein